MFGNVTFIESQSLAYEKYLNYFQFLLLLLYIAAFLVWFFSSDFIWAKNHLLFIFITLPSHLTGRSYLIPIVSYEHSFLSYKYLLPLIASCFFLVLFKTLLLIPLCLEPFRVILLLCKIQILSNLCAFSATSGESLDFL